MKTFKTLIGVAICLAVALSSTAVAVPPTPPNASTTIEFSTNPAILSGDSSTDVCITATTTSVETGIDGGKVTIQMATDGSSLVPPYVPVPAGPDVTWVDLEPKNQNPTAGVTVICLDLDALGFLNGTVGGFRAHYVTPSGAPPKPETHFSPAVDLTAITSCAEEGLTIAVDLATGEGSPVPGYEGCWTFRITLTNCTGNDLTGVKVQGGTNGWTNFGGYDQSIGDVSIKSNKKNEVLTWILDIENGATETLLVTMCGSIKPSTPEGTVLFLSGAWSAVYDDDGDPITPTVKTEYTGRVSITVMEPEL